MSIEYWTASIRLSKIVLRASGGGEMKTERRRGVAGGWDIVIKDRVRDFKGRKMQLKRKLFEV